MSYEVTVVPFRYFLYRRFALVQGERPVTDFGLPAGVSVDAALQWQGNSRTRWVHGSKTYLFAGKDYYRFDEQTRKIDRYYLFHNVARMCFRSSSTVPSPLKLSFRHSMTTTLERNVNASYHPCIHIANSTPCNTECRKLHALEYSRHHNTLENQQI